MKKQGSGIAGKIIAVIFLLVSLAFAGLLLYTKMIPTVLIVGISAVLLVLVLLVGILTWNSRKWIRFIVGVFLAGILSVVYIVGGIYIYKTTSAISQIANTNTEVAQIGIYVKADDGAESIEDTSGYTYGILSELDRDNSDHALEIIEEKTGQDVGVQEYRGLTELVDGLIRGEIGAIVLNQAYLDIIEEIDGYSKLDSMIRMLATENVETVIEPDIPEEPAAESEESEKAEAESPQKTSKKEKSKVYTIYISGIDTRGSMIAKSRSDVNIIAVANTGTRQLLLISTPRDYYVPLSISNGVPDKLTHAGIYGISVCMNTLGMLYDTEINYYVRMNFAGFVNIIDALGGIMINSDYEIDTKNVVGYHFNQGLNTVGGEAALAFARERYAYKEGDRQRGKNQLEVIKGVVDKALSPELLKNYSSILAGVEGCFETNISYEEIAGLLQQQLSEGGSWNVVSYSVDGTGDTQKPYSMSQKAYVMVPDYATVDHAKELMQKVRNGETIEQEASN